MNKKIVITGASGFLGKNLLKSLKSDNNLDIYALSSKQLDIFPSSNVTLVDRYIIDTNDANKILKDAIVVNCSFPRNSNGPEIADGLNYINKLFLSCIEEKASAIINISSQSVYSQKREVAANEHTELCLETPYAIGKYATELMLEGICTATSVPYTNIRMGSLIGPGFDQRIVNHFIFQSLHEGCIKTEINNKRYGFLDIDDAVTGLVAVIKSNPNRWEKVYNLGRLETYTLLEIAENIKDYFSTTKQLDVTIDQQMGTGDLNTALNSNLFMRDFAIHPEVTLLESIIKICEDIENHV